MMNFEFSVFDAVLQAVRREAAEYDRMDGPDARARQHRICSFRYHGQIDRDAIAFLDAMFLQDVGEALHPFGKLPVGDALAVIWVVAFPNDRDLIAARREMAIDAVRRNVERAVLEPFDPYPAGIEAGVLHLRIRLDPLNSLAVIIPKSIRVRGGEGIHFTAL